MLILALESSAKAASVALCRDGVLIAQSQQCSGLTHSCTLLPMAEQMLKNTDTRLADVDAIAVARGPGSFTVCASACPRPRGSPGARRNPPSACPRSRLWRITASRRGRARLCAQLWMPAAARFTMPCSRSGAENRCVFVKTVRFHSRSWRRTGKNAEIRFSGWRRRTVVL